MRLTRDILYAERPGQPLALDLYQPDGPASGMVIQAHGGGFFKGDRHGPRVKILAERLCDLGLALASIDYRLGTGPDAFSDLDQRAIQHNRRRALKGGVKIAKRMLGPAFEAARQDLGAAIDFLRANRNSFEIDSDKIAVFGVSAGGIAGLALAYPPDNLPAAAKPNAVIALGAALAHPWAVTPNGPPVLMLHSQQDRIIAPEIAELARSAAENHGASLTLLTCPRRGHNAPMQALLQDDAPDGTPYWDHMMPLFSSAGMISPSPAGA
ncbi:alpha/beta hydrolase [Shimia aestuarii]|uniref:Alpha/beta hydrolase family protein n=1 Tax=Shimia aestuarii TaxID=254406 RepID=A0A1I4NJ52_9RHOB|nr:alpha/beta hydrolase fold domain-containing protein [Shimia aestuarii]SFM15548.1 Alpha/beta hydrolase family protein [Shimia aestuarii]